ncbi:MAG: hypothetical protein QGG17_07525 [Rhodospirillales bacterium]|nr:hypothetical protein [Rhodospirillales bacterium]
MVGNFGQVLVDLGRDQAPGRRAYRRAQIAKGLRRCDDDETVERLFRGRAIDNFSHRAREFLFFEAVPIDPRFHGVARAIGALHDTARPVGAKLARRFVRRGVFGGHRRMQRADGTDPLENTGAGAIGNQYPSGFRRLRDDDVSSMSAIRFAMDIEDEFAAAANDTGQGGGRSLGALRSPSGNSLGSARAMCIVRATLELGRHEDRRRADIR